MKWVASVAKNGEATLSLNDVRLYSYYRPREDAWKWIDAEFDDTKASYLLIGLGFGYHAERLVQLANGKPVYVYYFDTFEYEQTPIKQAINNLDQMDLANCQILIPNAWLKALQQHPLFTYLEDIKIKQQSYKKFASIMAHNFEKNKKYFHAIEYPHKRSSTAYLVASGPSLNKTIQWIKETSEKADVYVVGSALKLLLNEGVKPYAAVISDAQPTIMKQLDASYNGNLYFLSTANAEAVASHNGLRIPIFQQGYPTAEMLAKTLNMPMLETGGSVSTVTISLLEYLGYDQIVMFGQDLGFIGEATHATLSTSGRKVIDTSQLRTVTANNGETIYTTPNLQVYMRWIEQKSAKLQATLYTTSKYGAAIKHVQCLTKEQLLTL